MHRPKKFKNHWSLRIQKVNFGESGDLVTHYTLYETLSIDMRMKT